MAAYATVDDLTTYGINKAAIAGMSPVDEIDPALESASRTIDSYISLQLTVPLVFVGGDIKRCCAIIAAYDLMSARGYNPDTGTAENLRLRYKDMLEWLKMIAQGTVLPETEPTPGDGASTIGRPTVVTSEQRGYNARGISSRYPFQAG